MSKEVKEKREDKKTGRITNYMGGNSFEWNPLDTLRMVTASSIFGEPQYYRDGEWKEKGIRDGIFEVNAVFKDYVLDCFDKFKGLKTSGVMEQVIDDALDYDYDGVLSWAVTLRKDYYMRLNPQIIMVRAALHEKRIEWAKSNPGKFNEINMKVMSRADDVISQVTYYLFKNGSKAKVPNILKRSWAKKVSSLWDWEVHKYKNSGIGMIDVVRICHATSNIIDELMTTGDVKIEESRQTWEVLRSGGKTWTDILNTTNVPHMALLRNLRGIFSENSTDIELADSVVEKLKSGVKTGKQFPFRYMSALNAVNACDAIFADVKTILSDGLEDCMDIACENLPKLVGNNAFLSDNSGSAWGTLTSEYGSVKVANIDNLSATIGAYNSDHGTVVKFGDEAKYFPISKRRGILSQAHEIDNTKPVGQSTENGVWLFFDKAIKEEIHYDNIFIYSDMQAGHGGLYGINPDNYSDYKVKNRYIDVPKLIKAYREKVNPKVNVFCIQTAGYNNVLVPENGYRTSLLYGWTGKELLYAKYINDFWDEKDSSNNQ